MSSERPSGSEDAGESRDRPVSGGDKEPDVDRSDGQEDAGPSGSAEDRAAADAPQTGSGGDGGSGSDRGRANSLFCWLQSRTIRRGVFVDPARDNFRTMTSLYCSMNPAAESVNLSSQTHGAVFNLEYSPDG